MILFTLGGCSCSAKQKASFATVSVAEQRATSFPESPALQCLADLGAWIYPDTVSKWIGRGVLIEFRDQPIDPDSLSAVVNVRGTVFLSFVRCRFHLHALKPLSGMENLKSLAIRDGSQGELRFGDIAALPGLEEFVAGPHEQRLSFLETATGLMTVALEGRAVNDETLVSLADHDRLISIELWHTSVTDSGLVHLSRLPGLLRLTINDSYITDAGARQLVQLEELRYLALRKANITSAGVADLSRLPKLQELDLAWTRVSDVGLGKLAELSQLESLDLSYTDITDDAFRDLAQLPGLVSLAVRGTKITDIGVRELAPARIGDVDARYTRVTPAVRAVLPKTVILLEDERPRIDHTAIASYFSTKLRRIRSSTSVERLAR